MKISTLSIFLAALLSIPQSSLAITIPVRRGDVLHESDRRTITKPIGPDSDGTDTGCMTPPPYHLSTNRNLLTLADNRIAYWYNNVKTKCGVADCRNLALAIGDLDIAKRAPPLVIPKPVGGGRGGVGAGAGGEAGGAAGSAGRVGAGVGAGAAGAGRAGVGADGTINPGAVVGGTKRPLSPDVEGGVGQGDAKEPKVGAGPGSEDGSGRSSPNRAAADDPFTGDNLAVSSSSTFFETNQRLD